jgi:hypothetical protein
MVKKSQPGRDKQIAAAFMLSYPQLFVWALIFAFIGGVTVWSSNAWTGNQNSGGHLTLRMVADNNHDGQPNWNDTITFDTSAGTDTKPTLKVSCYQNGSNVFYTQKAYGASVPSAENRYFHLSSTQWANGGADCNAALLDVRVNKVHTLSSYNFHVNP